MEFEKCNLVLIVGLTGLILIALSLIFKGIDGYLLKICLVLIGVAMGLPVKLPDIFKEKE